MKMSNRVKKHSLKFLAVFLSLFIWIYVLNSEKVKFEKTIALEYILPVDMVFAEKPIQEVILMIEGPRAFVRTVAEKDDRIIIDLNRANPRNLLNFSIDINPAQINLPFGMTIERFLPRKINIKLESKARKIVPLKLQFSGHLPDKYSLQSAALEPAEVEIYGPRSLISKLKEISVRPIELDSLPLLDQVPVDLQLPDEGISVADDYEIKFKYQLKAASSNFVLKNIPIRFLTEKRKIVSSVKVASVKLLLPEKIVKNRSNISSSVQIWADIPKNASGRTEVPLKVVLPPTIHLLEVTPKSIIVNVQ